MSETPKTEGPESKGVLKRTSERASAVIQGIKQSRLMRLAEKTVLRRDVLLIALSVWVSRNLVAEMLGLTDENVGAFLGTFLNDPLGDGFHDAVAETHHPDHKVTWEEYNQKTDGLRDIGIKPIDELNAEEQSNFDQLEAKHDAQIRDIIRFHIGHDVDDATFAKIKAAGGFIEPDGTKIQLFYNGHSPMGGVTYEVTPAEMKSDFPQLDENGKIVDKPVTPESKGSPTPEKTAEPQTTPESPEKKGGATEVAMELPDTGRDAALVATAQLGNPVLATFAGTNPNTDVTLIAAWDTIHSTLKSLPTDEWKTSAMTLSEFWKEIGWVK